MLHNLRFEKEVGRWEGGFKMANMQKGKLK